MENIKISLREELEQINSIILNSIKAETAIFRELKSFLQSPSKRVRSTLALLYLKSYNVSASSDVIRILAAGELIHNASLLHDDVIDEAEYRRGNTTIASKISDKISILSGDYILSKAVKQLLELNNLNILNIFMNCTESMSEAEIIQFSQRGKIPSPEAYLDICRGKTASLFEAILESSASITNLDTSKAKLLGKNFGILFQIKNDISYDSAVLDKKNRTYTANDIFGVEKTKSLIDNYIKDIKNIIETIPKNKYSESIEELLYKI